MNLTNLHMLPAQNHLYETMQWPNHFPAENNTCLPDGGGNFPATRDARRPNWPASNRAPSPCTPLQTPQSPPRLGLPDEDTHDDATLEGDCGADNENVFQTSLHIAAEGGHEGMVDMLLASGRIAIDAYDSDANTALHIAVAGRKLAVTLRLLKYGANPNAENSAGWTPVHFAVRAGSVEIVEALVAHGGDLGRKARGGGV
jgi:Ankyrin repeats (3 copies)